MVSRYLLDTNVLLRWILPRDPLSPAARSAVRHLVRGGNTLQVCSQNLIEFWSVATRPVSANGIVLTPERTAHLVDRIERLLQVLEDTPAIYREWRRLVQQCAVVGRQVHDARIAACMLAHGVTQILTFNPDDFRRYPGIVPVSPHDVSAPAPGTPPQPPPRP